MCMQKPETLAPQIGHTELYKLSQGEEKAAFGTALRLKLSDLAACEPEAFPGLTRGMIVTVHRPWGTAFNSLSSAFWTPVAWRIRHHESRILGTAATEHHAMIYKGNGECWSQDLRFNLASLKEYKGCVLTFWDPGWSDEQANALMGECGVHRDSDYALWDIGMILGWSLTGSDIFLAAQDRDRWICSESVCVLCRKIRDAMFGQGDCIKKLPQVIADWLAAQNTPRLVIIPS